MATETLTEAPETLADLLRNLGDIPLERIRMKPPPGTAKEKDVIAARKSPHKRLCELVDGVLVEKAMSTRESLLAAVIVRLLGNFVDERDLGVVLGADGMLRLAPGLVRIPDVSFIPWERIADEEVTNEPIASYSPALAVEVLSPSNTQAEIDRKLRDYFFSDTRLVWVIQPKTQTAQVYTSPTESQRISKTGSLHGDPVVPGFTLALSELFSRTRSRRKRSS
jgi:Uma2 family endonuclease